MKTDVEVLKSILLGFGGNYAVVYEDDPDFYNLFTRGIYLDRPADIIIRGELCQCHKNSIFYWEKKKEKCFFMTGYALSSSGTWHQHSWVLENNKIIESTVNRIKYFGYILDNLESEIFLDSYKNTIVINK